jgi:hypothetical protein
MTRGARIARMGHRAIKSTYTVASNRACIRGSSEQNSFCVSTVPPELLQLLNFSTPPCTLF